MNVARWLEEILERRPAEEWREVSLPSFIGWLVFYALFLLHAMTSETQFLLIDHVNLVVHEAGHFFFSWFGETLTILGGTLMQLLVPLLIGIHFWWHRHTTAVTFCSFWFFENFLYIGTYMADARRVSLPLVGSGEHDWEILFGQWDVLHLDQTIGGATRVIGWCGMLATVAFLCWMRARGRRS
jgi:hypothetical protein